MLIIIITCYICSYCCRYGSQKFKTFAHKVCTKSYYRSVYVIRINVFLLLFFADVHRCKLCYLECKKRCNLRTHFRKKHGKCLEPNCNATFSSLSGHDMHYTRVHRKTRCVHCNQKFGGKEIKLHIETNHTASAICHLCGKTFLHPAALRYHCETVHTRETKLQCDICKQWLVQFWNEHKNVNACICNGFSFNFEGLRIVIQFEHI